MELQARVQAQMPFDGQMWKPGEVIPFERWMKATQTSRDALVSQKYVALIGEGFSTHDGAMPPATDAVTELAARVDGVEGKLDEVLQLLRGGAVPKKAKRAKKAKA